MMRFVSKATVTILAMVGLLMGGLLPAQASGTWTDLSSRLSVRKNRPVWAVAYAKPYWYFTDGQDLNAGGHVWRTDGTWTKDLTTDVRKAGLSRVDDIASDGKTVIYLKNVTQGTRNFEMLAYTEASSQYSYPASSLQQKMSESEGIASVSGKNGTWFAVTTLGRLIRWNTNSYDASVIALPTLINRSNLFAGFNVYSPTLSYHRTNSIGTASNPVIMAMLPVDNGQWILAASVSDTSGAGGNRVATYRFDGTTFTRFNHTGGDIRQSSFGIDLVGIASNGEKVALLTQTIRAGGSSLEVTEMTSTNVASPIGLYDTVEGQNPATANSPAILNTLGHDTTFTSVGNAWVIMNNKQMSLVTPGMGSIRATSFAVRDYFVDAASNDEGILILGGVQSALGNANPTVPMMAKLVKADFRSLVGSVNATTGSTSATNTTTPTPTTSAEIKSWTWFDPGVTSVTKNQTVTYNVGAWQANGVSRIDIVVNGAVRRVCDTPATTMNCSYVMYGGDYQSGTQVAVNAKVTAKDGTVAWTTLSSLSITADSSTQTTNGSASVSISSSPDKTALLTNESVTVNASAYDPDGVSKIEMVVNGQVRIVCGTGTTSYANQTCSQVVYGSDIGAGNTATVYARMTDTFGNTLQSSPRSYTVAQATTSDTSSGSANVNAWSSPDVTTLASNQTVTYNVSAYDPAGVQTIRMMVNGVAKQTCSIGNATNGSCAVTINANDYAGIDVFVNAEVTNKFGTITWSTARTYHPTTTSGTATSTSSNLTVTSDHDGGYSNTDTITFTAVANDPDGVSRIDLYVGGLLVKTCMDKTTCSYTGGPYGSFATVTYGAKMVDKIGHEVWVGYKKINHL